MGEEPDCAGTAGAGLLKHHVAEVGTVAVLTPYKAQVGVLRSAFMSRCGEEALSSVDFATVDGFQVGAACTQCTYVSLTHQHVRLLVNIDAMATYHGVSAFYHGHSTIHEFLRNVSSENQY